MKEIMPDHAEQARKWFEENKDNPLLKNKIAPETYNKIINKKSCICVFSSERCLACKMFFELVESNVQNLEWMQYILSHAPLLICDVDRYEYFNEIFKSIKPDEVTLDDYGLPVIIFSSIRKKKIMMTFGISNQIGTFLRNVFDMITQQDKKAIRNRKKSFEK